MMQKWNFIFTKLFGEKIMYTIRGVLGFKASSI